MRPKLINLLQGRPFILRRFIGMWLLGALGLIPTFRESRLTGLGPRVRCGIVSRPRRNPVARGSLISLNDRGSVRGCDPEKDGPRPPLCSEINVRNIGLDTHALLTVQVLRPRIEIRSNGPVPFDSVFSIDRRRCVPCHSFVGCLSFAGPWRY